MTALPRADTPQRTIHSLVDDDALQGLPRTLDDSRIGIADPDLADAVKELFALAIFSGKNGRHASRDGAGLRSLKRSLTLYANTPTPANRSERVAATLAPFPGFEPGPAAGGSETVRKELGISYETQIAMWEERVEEPIPVAVVCAYMSAELWKVGLAVIEDQPHLFHARAREALAGFSKLPGVNGKPPGPGDLANLAVQFNRFVRPLAAIAQSWDVPALDGWRGGLAARVRAPSSKRVVPPGGIRPNTAPPIHETRRAMDAACRRVLDLLRLRDRETEDQAIKRHHREGRDLNALGIPLRNRAIFALYNTTGGRLSAVGGAIHEDVDFARRTPLGVLPAVLLPIEKKDQESTNKWGWWPLAPELGEWLEVYFEWKRLCLGIDSSGGRPREAILDAGERTKRRGIFHSTKQGDLTAWGIQYIFDSNFVEHPDREASPYRRTRSRNVRKHYNCHCYRHRAAKNLTEPGAFEWCRQRGINVAELDIISTTYLGHEPDNALRALYTDALTPEAMERRRGQGSLMSWGLLRTDLGSRRTPDQERYDNALRARLDLHEQLLSMEARFAREQRDVTEGRIKMEGAQATMMVAGQSSQLRAVDRQMAEVERTIAGIESHAWAYLLAHPDELPDEQLPSVNLEEVKARFEAGMGTGGAGVGVGLPLRQRRTTITPGELADILMRNPSTPRSWVSDGLPNRVNGLPCLPWDPERPPIVIFSETRRGIYVPGIDPRVFDSPEKRRKLAETLASDPPEGWTHLDMNVPDPCPATAKAA